MALSQALSTGISGLVTHQKAMDNVGNNLANVNTTGFKKGVFQFRTLLEQSYRGGMGADAQTGRGSINPIQLGLGTQTGSINKVFTQGPLENTSNPNDLAIEGNGFFVLRQGNGYAYTRDGAFYLGSDGSLMGGNGLYVQGTMAVKDAAGDYYIPSDSKLENIVIPLGETGGMVQTSTVEFGGNVNSNQKVSQGLRLFGGTSYPTVSNLQQWMWKSDFNGGDPYVDQSVDASWNSLEEKTYTLPNEMLELARERGHNTDSIRTDKTISTYTSNLSLTSLSEMIPSNMLNSITGKVESVPSSITIPVTNPDGTLGTRTLSGKELTVDALLRYGKGLTDPTDPTSELDSVYIPVIEEVKTINGGNVQTSAAYAVSVPAYETRGKNVGSVLDPATNTLRTVTIQNDFTYPEWFYESTGAIPNHTYAEIVDALNGMQTPINQKSNLLTDASIHDWTNPLVTSQGRHGTVQTFTSEAEVIAFVNAKGPLQDEKTQLENERGPLVANKNRLEKMNADAATIKDNVDKGITTYPQNYTYNNGTGDITITFANDADVDAFVQTNTDALAPINTRIGDINARITVIDSLIATTYQEGIDRKINDTIANYIWPNGINGDIGNGVTNPGWGGSVTQATLQFTLPRQGEIFPASLDTPLEQLRYRKGNAWTQPFANIKDGDEITVSFKKGQGQIEATFVYNRPGPEPLNPPQQPIDIEKSYTLEHFLKFLAGDVDEPSVACMNITPAMFGAPTDDPKYPDGNPNASGDQWDRAGYEAALQNVRLAQSSRNLDEAGGAMGLLSIPPRVSAANYGDDMYDAPVESAGAYTRSIENDIKYSRYDELGNLKEESGDSFRVSLVSNLGQANALSDIRISYNNVTHEAMFSGETEYAAPEGGFTSATMTFYDSLGNPKEATVRMAMVSQDNDFTTWRWYADCIDDTDFGWQVDENGEVISNLNVGTGLIRFDKNGNYVKGAEYTESGGITINQSNLGVNEPITVKMLNGLSSSDTQDLDFSSMKMSAKESDFALKNQNGRPPGTLDSFQVSADGVVQGVYSNGVTAPIARLVLAMIPNMNGLIAGGGSIFYTGPSSGDAQIGYANLGGRGEIHQGQLESSNVDLSEEFTKLISIERGFQANSRTITTADEMLQELLNLKR